MIARRPGIWETLRGEGTDEDSSSKGIGMSGLQEEQQVKTVESSRPGSSGSSGSSSSSEWGSCSELLLVSAVKKHGVTNWNLVASELKARADLLNISPSCFTEEACKFKYNVLKGKFASSGSSGGGSSVSSPDDDLDGGVTWFEELRKLRMSHLKEELQVYDSSIGQLQSRISKLQDERALQEERPQYLSPQSAMKQQCHSNCRAESHPKGCKSPDIKPSIPTCLSEESFETAHDSALTNAAEGASPAENIPVTSGDLDPQEFSVMEVEELGNQRDSPATSTPHRLGQDCTDEVVERGADMKIEQNMSLELPTREITPEKEPDKGEEQVFLTTSTDALQVRKDEIAIEEPDLEISASTADQGKVEDQANVEDQSVVEDQAVVEDRAILEDQAVGEDQATVGYQAIEEKPSETPPGEADAQVRGDGVDSAVAHDMAMPEKVATVGWEDRAAGTDSEPDMAMSTSCPQPELPSTSTAVDTPEDLLARDSVDSLEALGVASGASSPCRALEREARNSTGTFDVDSSSKRESRWSRLGLSYGRAEKEKRLKAKEEAKLKQMSRPQLAKPEDHQLSESTIEEAAILEVQETDIKDTSIPLEQSEKGRNSSLMGEAIAESLKQDVVVPDSPTPAIAGDGADNCVQCSGLSSESHPTNPVDVDDRPSHTDVNGFHPAGSYLVLSKGVEPSSPEDEIPLLTVALGPDPELAELRPSDVITEVEPRKATLESSPNPKSEEVSKERNLMEETAVQAAEIPNEVKSASSSMIPSETDVKSEDAIQEVDNLMMESEVVEVRKDDEGKEDEVVGMVIEGNEGETPETDLGISRSVDEGVPEIVETKGSENRQEHSRDRPEAGEVQQPFPDCTDNQIDKSEVGSSMDSIEDMSPSSRKNRREPKVPGKFLPLLECLRVICAHKFAPLFRQRQEYQDNARYDRLVRRHVDLSMVRSRLEDGAYSGSVEFFRDLLLIFTNALVYNSSDSQEYVGAKALRSCALTEMDKILQTEALLKQNGPATRKREVRKSMEVHKARVSNNSAGSEVRKKGILKGNTESPAALDSQGGAKSAHIPFEDTPHAGRSSNDNDVDRDLDVKIETTFKKAAANRVFKEETPRKESQKPEFLIESGNRVPGGSSGKKIRVDRDFQKTSLQGQVLADLRASGGRLNVESIGNKTTPAKMKDMSCIDIEKKGAPNNSCSLVSSGLSVEKQRTTPISRQSSTSRVSRYSKRGGDSTPSNSKKRVRK